jgi:hypothetical protein
VVVEPLFDEEPQLDRAVDDDDEPEPVLPPPVPEEDDASASVLAEEELVVEEELSALEPVDADEFALDCGVCFLARTAFLLFLRRFLLILGSTQKEQTQQQKRAGLEKETQRQRVTQVNRKSLREERGTQCQREGSSSSIHPFCVLKSG